MSFFKHRIFSTLVLATTSFFISLSSNAAGLMQPKQSSLPALQIRQHHVNVIIEDGYAITTVDQVFFNPNGQDLEAIYSFPVPEKASVGEFTYWIDNNPITGEVVEKERAREIYEQEKSQGREAAVTEQDEYKTFDISVFPVRAQSDVKIRLVYIQPTHVDSSIGRYVYPLEEGGVDEERLAFWSYNDAVTESFTFNVDLRSSYPVDEVRLPQHPQAQAQAISQQEWRIRMANQQGSVDIEESPTATAATKPAIVQRLDKDIVVYWRHQQGLPGSIDMITHKAPGENRGTFMLTVTPGDDLGVIEQGRDWVFVLDFSGSMEGKYHSLIEGVKLGLSKLNSKDRFRIVLFNNAAMEVTNGYVPATPDQVQAYIQMLESRQPTGGTNLYAGLENGIRGLDSDRPSAVILVTDGVANVGITEKKQFLKLLEQHDVRLFTFVMGNSANRPLLDGMTKISNGFAMSISNSDDIVGNILLATNKLSHQALRDVELDIDGVKVKELSPARIGSLYRGQQLIVFGHYWGDGDANLSLRGKIGAEEKTYRTRVNFPAQETRNPEIERLWAFAGIEDLQNKMDYLGEDSDSREAIIDIAKEFSLVTNYTSMLVLREEMFQHYNIDRNAPNSNAKRVEKEQHAREQRAASPVKDNRADTQQPAFNAPRATPKPRSGGGGAAGPWIFVLLLPLMVLKLKNRRRTTNF